MIVASAIKGRDGKIYTGKRHCNIINDNNLNLPKGFFKGCEQGFVTDTGIFLNREEAAKFALSIGQIKELKFNSTDLFSEDLW